MVYDTHNLNVLLLRTAIAYMFIYIIQFSYMLDDDKQNANANTPPMLLHTERYSRARVLSQKLFLYMRPYQPTTTHINCQNFYACMSRIYIVYIRKERTVSCIYVSRIYLQSTTFIIFMNNLHMQCSAARDSERAIDRDVYIFTVVHGDSNIYMYTFVCSFCISRVKINRK